MRGFSILSTTYSSTIIFRTALNFTKQQFFTSHLKSSQATWNLMLFSVYEILKWQCIQKSLPVRKKEPNHIFAVWLRRVKVLRKPHFYFDIISKFILFGCWFCFSWHSDEVGTLSQIRHELFIKAIESNSWKWNLLSLASNKLFH